MKGKLFIHQSFCAVVLSILFLNLLFAFTSNAQNLVSNPGFETFTTCPNTASQLQFATGWNTSSNSPDYFDVCAGNGNTAGVPANICGYQQPASGDGYIGLLAYGSFASTYIANIREFAAGTLSSPLVVGATYSVSFKVVLMNMSSHEVDHIGAKFTTVYDPGMPISNSAHIFSLTSVSDTLNWTTISGTFVADSAYNFIVIGNHFNDANCIVNSIQAITFGWNAYYFVDDVEVVELNQVPTALFSAPNHICPGTCTDFTNLSISATSYQWTFTGANPSSSTDLNPTTICYNVPGTYSVQLIASNANGIDTLTLNNYITVFPYPAPQGIMQSGDSLIANQGAVSYQWYHSGILIPGATDYYYVQSEGGDFNVVCTDVNGCEVEAVIFDVPMGIEAVISSGSMQLFPNPVVEKLAIGNCQSAIKAISIYNLLGDLVMAVSLPTTNRSVPTEVDVSRLLPGMYWLEVSSSEKTYRNKFIKE